MKVYVVVGYNGILKASGAVGVATTKKLADRIAKEHEYMLDKVDIQEFELTDS